MPTARSRATPAGAVSSPATCTVGATPAATTVRVTVPTPAMGWPSRPSVPWSLSVTTTLTVYVPSSGNRTARVAPSPVSGVVSPGPVTVQANAVASSAPGSLAAAVRVTVSPSVTKSGPVGGNGAASVGAGATLSARRESAAVPALKSVPTAVTVTSYRSLSTGVKSNDVPVPVA